MSETQTRRRVSMTQLHHLWEFLSKHREIAVGYNKSTQARDHNRRMWERAAEILNSIGEGAIKSGPEWSKYWVDMKSKLKNKNRLINNSRRRTGGGPATKLELSDIDRKFLSILGEDYGTGLPGVRVEPNIPQEALVLHVNENEDNTAGPSNVDTSQSTENEEPVYLEVLSSEEYQPSEPHEVVAAASSPALLLSPSRQGATTSAPVDRELTPLFIQSTTGRSARRRLVLTDDTTSPLTHHQPPHPPLALLGTPEVARTRRRRRQRFQMTAADARERLVISSERRAQAEIANSQSLGRMTDSLSEMLSVLRQIQAGLSDAAARGVQQDPAL